MYQNFGQANASLSKFFKEQQARVATERRELASIPRPQGIDKNAAFSVASTQHSSNPRTAPFSMAQASLFNAADVQSKSSTVHTLTEAYLWWLGGGGVLRRQAA